MAVMILNLFFQFKNLTLLKKSFPRVFLAKRAFHCVKNVQIRSFFWSVFSCIRTKYGDLLCNSVRIGVALRNH